VGYFDAALPGTMPTLNRHCVESGLLSALALKCNINARSYFERKHYFYTDLPAGYQITQQRCPIAWNGIFKYPIIETKTNKLLYKTCRIKRLQLEHDSARTLKVDDLNLKLNENEKLPNNSTLVDLNRAGMGLMEIVTEPDFEDAIESYSFARELALVLRSLGTCDAKMAEGGFRVDVNISVHRIDKETQQLLPGTRVELKNINTFTSLLRATQYEIKRQKKLLSENKPIELETRAYDSETNQTVSLRTKDNQYDYRFMPEPNLLPLFVYPSKSFHPNSAGNKCSNNPELCFDENYLNRVTSFQKVPELYIDLDLVKQRFESKVLPQTRREILVNKYHLSQENAFTFIANDLDYILVEILKDKKNLNKDQIHLYVRTLLLEYLNQLNTNVHMNEIEFDLKCKKIDSFVELVSKKMISSRIKAKFFAILFEPANLDKMAFELANEKQMLIVNDDETILKAIEKLFQENPKAVSEYKSKDNKRHKIFDFFVGRVHKDLNDLADPELVDQLVLSSLKRIL
jgi:aspartyl-tRNA(Asn)/glutamyl-tRNA(Gln) amidotransferase subunit B